MRRGSCGWLATWRTGSTLYGDDVVVNVMILLETIFRETRTLVRTIENTANGDIGGPFSSNDCLMETEKIWARKIRVFVVRALFDCNSNSFRCIFPLRKNSCALCPLVARPPPRTLAVCCLKIKLYMKKMTRTLF